MARDYPIATVKVLNIPQLGRRKDFETWQHGDSEQHSPANAASRSSLGRRMASNLFKEFNIMRHFRRKIPSQFWNTLVRVIVPVDAALQLPGTPRHGKFVDYYRRRYISDDGEHPGILGRRRKYCYIFHATPICTRVIIRLPRREGSCCLHDDACCEWPFAE